MLAPGHLLRYKRTPTGITIYIQSVTDSKIINQYHFNKSKQGQQSLRRYLDYLTRRMAKTKFSSKMTNDDIINAIIEINRMKGLVK